MRKIFRGYIHHTESPQNYTTWKGVRGVHLIKGFDTWGYHWGVMPNGKIEKGRNEKRMGAHVANADKTKFDNRETIGVCAIGNFDYEEPTTEQIESLVTKWVDICKRYPTLLPSNILGHCDFKGVTKTCPGKNLYKKLPYIRRQVKYRLCRDKWIEFLMSLIKKIFRG